jgi:hypothetical protein
MTILRNIWHDLREKHLWPVAAVLIAALIAVPVLASTSSSPTGAPPAPGATGGRPAANVPAIEVAAAPGHGRFTGAGRNPFTQLVKPQTASSAATPATSSTPAQSPTPVGTGSSSGASTATTPSSTTTPTNTAPSQPHHKSIIPKHKVTKSAPAPTGLTPTESYDVAVAMTTVRSGLTTYDRLERLTELPSTAEPFLIELGPLKGGHAVLFTVQPGTDVRGPATCIPGPADCQLLAMAPGQVEDVLGRLGRWYVAVQLSVSRVSIVNHGSQASAQQARQAESAAGRSLLNRSPLSALSLFHYSAGDGIVIDHRRLTATTRTARALPAASTHTTRRALAGWVALTRQSLASAVHDGISLRVASDALVAGIASVSIPRREARLAHLRASSSQVVIGRGTIGDLSAGVSTVTLRLSHDVAAKLARLQRVTMAVDLALTNAGHHRVAIDASGTY